MIVCKTKQWGSSLGIVIPKKVVNELHLTENQEIAVELQPKTNVLKELFGAGKRKYGRTTEQIIKEARAEMGVD
jgi:antitoxin component of MazEF toxin-antitoxin module